MTKKQKQERDRKKQRTEALCRLILRGDKKAEAKLRERLDDPRVREIVEDFVNEGGGINVLREQNVIMTAVNRGQKAPTKGNAFKPYKGGLPSLGKKS